MKPILLRMRAFGSYADEAVVDFTQFTSGLYWITGDTGAGKTTIFDAIVFALYGKASGSSRQMWMLHSDFVPLSTKTEVELVFEHAGYRSSVCRTIRYSKKRGSQDAYGDAKQEASLTENGKAPIEGAQKVTDRVEELLGMDVNQFRKIVMLAQGEFQEFLKADSKERGAILGKLFDSSPYLAFQRRLSSAENELDDRKKEMQHRIEVIMETFQMPEGLEEEQRAQLTPNHPRLVEHLEALLESDAVTLKKRKTEKDQAEEARLSLVKQQQVATEHNERLEALTAARKKQVELQGYQDEMVALQERYDAAERAWRRARPAVQAAAEKSSALKELFKRIGELETALEEARKAEQVRKEAVETNAEARHRIDLLKAEIADLRKVLPDYTELEAADRDLRKAEKEASRLESEYSAKEQGLAEMKQLLEEIAAELEGLEGIDGDVAEARQEQEAARVRVDHLSGENGLQARVLQLVSDEAELDRKEEELRQRTKSALDAEKVHHRLYQVFLEGQAGVMARGLAEELAKKGYGICPVCRTEFSGAHHHAFAKQAEEMPTQAEVEDAKRQWQTEEEQRQRADKEQTERKVDFKSRRDQVLEVAQELFGVQVDWKTLSAEGFLAEAITNAEDSLKKKEQVCRDREARQKHRQELIKAQKMKTEEKDKLDAELQELQSELSQVKTAQTIAREKKENIEKRLPYPSWAEAESEMKRLDGTRQKMQDQVDADQAAWEQAKSLLDKTQGELTAEKKKQSVMEAGVREAEQGLDEILTSVGFGDLAAYETALEPIGAMDGEDWLARKKACLDEYYTVCRDNEQEIRSLEEETAGWQLSDMKELSEKLERAKQRYMETDEAYHACEWLADNHSTTLKQICAIKSELEKIGAAHGRLRYLSSLANGGQSDEDGKLSFERYVMGSVFREILEQANVRLSKMSGGKYELIHVVQEQGGRSNAQSGLGIELLDLITGKQRATASISGGESFMVSMALALGLSDVVQNRSGGSALEAMFIDEGFGSLDERVLDTAISVLEQLAGGNRLVGVISHVAKLEECITQQIYVTSGENGSHLRVQA